MAACWSAAACPLPTHDRERLRSDDKTYGATYIGGGPILLEGCEVSGAKQRVST